MHRLLVHASEERKRRVIPVGEIASVTWITARPLLIVFREHPPLRGTEVTEDVAERVFAWLVGPVDLLWRNACGHAQCAFADAIEVVGKITHVARIVS